jgi:hypothetical protein
LNGAFSFIHPVQKQRGNTEKAALLNDIGRKDAMIIVKKERAVKQILEG